MLNQRLQQSLQEITAKNLLRRPTVQSQQLLQFCSNDYLGLANHSRVVQAFQTAAEQYGVGSTGSHLISGHNVEHQQLEQALAEFTQREAALTFSTGYMANMGVLDALSKLLPEPIICSDELNHASLIDGCRLSKAEVRRYAHASVESLQCQAPDQEHLVVTDGLFSMDGDIAPLNKLAEHAKANKGWLVVDDAHGFGVLGNNGGGSCEHFGLGQAEVPILIGTFGKAFGTAGAFVAGSRDLIDYLVQRARTYIYTTAMPPALAAATHTALELMQAENWRREHLKALIEQFRAGVQALGLNLLPSETPIQPIIIGNAADTLAWSEVLLDKGVSVTGIRPPTVPQDTGRLRITLSAAHSQDDIEQLLVALADVKAQMNK